VLRNCLHTNWKVRTKAPHQNSPASLRLALAHQRSSAGRSHMAAFWQTLSMLPLLKSQVCQILDSSWAKAATF
jgi:hypothetical protein